MDKDLELYLEEQRDSLIKLNNNIMALTKVVAKQLDSYVAPKDNVLVSGEVKVNTEKAVEVTNLESLQAWLKDLEVGITSAIKKAVREPVNEVTVKNIHDSRQDTIKITNFKELNGLFDKLNKTIEDNKAVVNVAKQDLRIPTNANEAIPVRLSDGKSFYKAIVGAMSGTLNFADSTGRGVQVVLNDDGSIPVTTKEKDIIEAYDYATAGIIYIGEAPQGSQENEAVWKITKYDFTDSSNANGKLKLNGVWLNRKTEIYT